MTRSFAFRNAFVGLGLLALSIPLTDLASGQEIVSARPSATKTDRGYTIGKETTYFTGPLKSDGTIDFFAAINDHFANGVTAENNAARFIVPLLDPVSWGPQLDEHRADVLRALGLDPAKHPGEKAFWDINSYVKDGKLSADVGQEQYTTALKRPWRAAEFPELARWLDENREPLEEIRRGSKLERFHVPLLPLKESESLLAAQLEHVQASRSLARAYVIRANLHMGHQRWVDAWEDILTIDRLGKLIAQGPTLVQNLVGNAIVGMACEQAKQLVEIAESDQVDWPQLLASWQPAKVGDVGRSLGISERAMFIQIACGFVDGVETDFPFVWSDSELNVAANKLMNSTLQKMLQSEEIDLDDTLRYANGIYDEMVELSEIDDIQARNEAFARFKEKVTADLGAKPDRPIVAQIFFAPPREPYEQMANVLLGQLLPAIDAVHSAQWRIQASQQVVELALAARTIQAQTGGVPHSGRELEPLVDRAMFIQPASGDQIPVSFDRGELLIYHWGHNRKDDLGDVGSPDQNPKDWGIRLR